MFTYTVLTSKKTSDAVVEPYDCVLGIHQKVENSDVTICLDNEALYGLCNRNLKIGSPT